MSPTVTENRQFGEGLAQAHRRLDIHEARLTSVEIESARHAVQSQNIDKRLSEIQSGISWITRLVLGAIVAGVIAFIMAGGLHVAS